MRNLLLDFLDPFKHRSRRELFLHLGRDRSAAGVPRRSAAAGQAQKADFQDLRRGIRPGLADRSRRDCASAAVQMTSHLAVTNVLSLTATADGNVLLISINFPGHLRANLSCFPTNLPSLGKLNDVSTTLSRA